MKVLLGILASFISCITSLNSIATQQPEQIATPIKQQSNVLTSALTTTKMTGKTAVQLCTSLPRKGESALIGNQIFDGLTLFFNKVKKEDKTGSLVVNLSCLDDHADIRLTRANTKKLLKNSPIFTSFFGTNSMTAIKEFIHQKQLAIFFPIDGMELFRRQEHDNIVYFRPPNTTELAALVHYAIERLNKKRIAIFYEASPWGEECCTAVKNILNDKYHLTPVAQGSYQYKTINISAAVKNIVASAPNAIICIGQARPSYNFIQQALNLGLHQTTFLGLGQLYSIQAPLKKSRGVNIYTSSVVPNPLTSKLAIAKEYRTDMKKYFANKPLSPFSLEGYINATLFYAALTYTNPPLTPQKILAVLTQFNNFKFKGLTLTFNTQTRALSPAVWINTGAKNEWFLSPIN